MLLPTTREEAARHGWTSLDVIIVTGDAYIDSPYNGAAVIGTWLAHHGFSVGIIAQPATGGHADIRRLGEPNLFWGVTAGAMDSMVANYTPTKKYRNQDDLTPGGVNIRRPDRACIAYTNLIRAACRTTRPIVLGGIEASLRRIAHYDYWSNTVRRSVLFDAKADALIYGMGEMAALELARKLRGVADSAGPDNLRAAAAGIYPSVRGLCYIAPAPPAGYTELPPFEKAATDRDAFIDMFTTFYHNNDPLTAAGLCQRHGDRYLAQNPPQPAMTTAELDEVYDMSFTRQLHPACAARGAVRAMDTIATSLTTHRGCYGECNFCAIAVHQGRTVVSRSEESILREAQAVARMPGFTGCISDVGGPTANMYGIECSVKTTAGACRDKRCLFPAPCARLPVNHSRQTKLLQRLRALPGVKKVFVGSGVRYDMVLADTAAGQAYLDEIVGYHVSGQMKIAPEHASDRVLALMGKPGAGALKAFIARFAAANARFNKRQFLTYYFIAAHPGCTMRDMQDLKTFVTRELKLRPEQVQVFTPTPSTWSTVMYWTGVNPFTRAPLAVEKDPRRKELQKLALK